MILVDTVLPNDRLKDAWEKQVAKNQTRLQFKDWIEQQEVMIVLPVYMAKEILALGVRDSTTNPPKKERYVKLVKKLRLLTHLNRQNILRSKRLYNSKNPK